MTEPEFLFRISQGEVFSDFPGPDLAQKRQTVQIVITQMSPTWLKGRPLD